MWLAPIRKTLELFGLKTDKEIEFGPKEKWLTQRNMKTQNK